METREASVVPKGWLRVLFWSVALVALAPVAGMVFAFAIVPALPIVLGIGYVLGPMNWLADLEDRRNEHAAAPGEAPSSWEAHHGALAHAH
jgi:hypothetical protein